MWPLETKVPPQTNNRVRLSLSWCWLILCRFSDGALAMTIDIAHPVQLTIAHRGGHTVAHHGEHTIAPVEHPLTY